MNVVDIGEQLGITPKTIGLMALTFIFATFYIQHNDHETRIQQLEEFKATESERIEAEIDFVNGRLDKKTERNLQELKDHERRVRKLECQTNWE